MNTFDFRRINSTSVPGPLLEAAAQALERASADLGIDSPAVQWVLPERADTVLEGNPAFIKSSVDFSGRVTWGKNEIMISAALSPREVVKTILHECRHIQQANHYRTPRSREEISAAERDASGYEAKSQSLWERFSSAPSEWAQVLSPALFYRGPDQASGRREEIKSLIAQLRVW